VAIQTLVEPAVLVAAVLAGTHWALAAQGLPPSKDLRVETVPLRWVALGRYLAAAAAAPVL
jgi:hypothetical protein